MSKLSKKQQAIQKALDSTAVYTLPQAIDLAKQFASKNFEEGLDISLNLGVDPRKSDQAVRLPISLPEVLEKTVCIAVFAQGDNAKKAKEAGADIVGFEDLAQEIKNGKMDFDVVIATPDAMRLVGQLGQILGPQGKMPNPKLGTVTPNVVEAITKAKSGQVMCRTDKNGIIHCTVGKLGFSSEALTKNIMAVIDGLRKAKPQSSKGNYFKKISLSSTMGPGLRIDLSSISV